MAATPEGLKEYLRLPSDSTESLDMYLMAAKSKARAAGVPDYANNAQYDLFIYTLAAMYFDGRGVDLGEKEQRMINSFVLELRYAGEDTEENLPESEG